MNNKSNLQAERPQRSCKKKYSSYSPFKEHLRNDFNKRCGYCDDDDFYLGGIRGFQIDHFKPKLKFPELENEYSNFVYSCPYCNRAKWDKWRDKKGFVDPCSAAYGTHLVRGENGKISYTTEQGEFMYRELKLGMERHEVLWLIRRVSIQKDALKVHIDRLKQNKGPYEKLACSFYDIQARLDHYTEKIHNSI